MNFERDPGDPSGPYWDARAQHDRWKLALIHELIEEATTDNWSALGITSAVRAILRAPLPKQEPTP